MGALLIALLVLSSAGPPASAGRRVVIKGGGWGHGIGMSQYGAYGRALRGASAKGIVKHYYRHTRLVRKHMPKVRVGLLQYQSVIELGSRARRRDGGKLVFKVRNRRVAKGGDHADWRIEPSSTGGMRIYKDGDKVKRRGRTVFGGANRPLKIVFGRYGTRARVKDKDTSYTYGRLELGTYRSGSCGPGYCMRLVLSIKMERYLYGLGEVPASWPHAALKAQAIAGRTYAFEKHKRLGRHRYPCNCTVYDSTYDQAYIGDTRRTSSGRYWNDWKHAVKDSKRKVLVHRGQPIQALYSSSSGGHTENNENVWGGSPLKYLRGVRDRADKVSANPNHRWKEKMSWRGFSSRLNAAYGTGRLKRFKVVKPRGVSGRVTIVKDRDSGGVKIRGSHETVRASGWSVRSALGLRDSLFRVKVYWRTAAVFEAAYRASGGARGPLGHATGPATGGRGGHPVQDFEGGAIYGVEDAEAAAGTDAAGTDAVAAMDAVALWGPIAEAYDELGGPASACGRPTGSIGATEGLSGVLFERGRIELARRGRVTVDCG